jgi:hypothetical protein
MSARQTRTQAALAVLDRVRDRILVPAARMPAPALWTVVAVLYATAFLAFYALALR